MESGSDRPAVITDRLQSSGKDSPPLRPMSTDNDHHSDCKPTQLATREAGYGDNADNDQEHDHHAQNHPPQVDGEDETMSLINAAEVSNDSQRDHRPNAEKTTQPQVASPTSSDVDTKQLIKASSSDDDHEDAFTKSKGGRRRADLLSCFTAKEINSCIVSSEDTRVFCSIMIALLVVIAYANLPRHIVKSKSLIASRPLYVLLLSDVMIVILRITSNHPDSDRMGVEVRQVEPNINWDGAIKVLEWGLVLYHTVRALFIDCSFYTVIVTCAFAFM